ncbi:unnamed protein product [Linum tenue]|uniref:Uncharacterized protein n=1 Tax=Linum tenue TaxID=586396 RepID=A0AAV0JRJ9_9ROSI|nr:unnamed protein product [Linum tenue]
MGQMGRRDPRSEERSPRLAWNIRHRRRSRQSL